MHRLSSDMALALPGRDVDALADARLRMLAAVDPDRGTPEGRAIYAGPSPWFGSIGLSSSVLISTAFDKTLLEKKVAQLIHDPIKEMLVRLNGWLSGAHAAEPEPDDEQSTEL